MENNKKTYENRSKNSFRKSFFVHHQAAWGLLHPTSGCSTMARRCFNAASGKRSVAAFPWNIVPWISSLFQCRKRQEVCCNLLLCRQSRQRLVRFQCRKRQEVCCNSDNIYFFNWLSKVSMPQAARGLLQHWLCNRANPSTAGFNAASGKRSVATIRFRIWWSEQYVSMPQAARGLLQLSTSLSMIHAQSCFNAASGKRSVATLCPGSRMNTGLKMRFWTTSTKKHPFGTFFAWTPFRFLVKNWLQPLLLKGSTCPWFVWTTYPRFDPFSRLSNCLLVYTFLLGSSSAW